MGDRNRQNTQCQHPASMTHSTYTREERARHGISEGLVRLSVGLESLADIQADIARALDLRLLRALEQN
jgi:methionine-gamma-lyase